MLLVILKSLYNTGPFSPREPHLLSPSSAWCDPSTLISYLFVRHWQIVLGMFCDGCLFFASAFAFLVVSGWMIFLQLLTLLVPSYFFRTWFKCHHLRQILFWLCFLQLWYSTLSYNILKRLHLCACLLWHFLFKRSTTLSIISLLYALLLHLEVFVMQLAICFWVNTWMKVKK